VGAPFVPPYVRCGKDALLFCFAAFIPLVGSGRQCAPGICLPSSRSVLPVTGPAPRPVYTIINPDGVPGRNLTLLFGWG